MDNLGHLYISILPFLFFSVFLLFGYHAAEGYLLYRKHRDKRSLFHILMCSFSAIYGLFFFLIYQKVVPSHAHKLYFTCWFIGFSSYLCYLYLIKWYLKINNRFFDMAKKVLFCATGLYFLETCSIWIFDHSFFMSEYKGEDPTPVFFDIVDLRYRPSLAGLIVGGIGATTIMATAIFTLTTLIRVHPKEKLLQMGVILSMCVGVNDIFLGLGWIQLSFAMVYLGNAFEAIRFTDFFQKLSYQKITELQGELSKVAKLAHVGFVASSINHDIMNPLAVIQGGREALQMKLKKTESLTPVIEKYLGMIDKNCMRITNIIGSYTALVRHDSSTDDLNYVSLKEVIDESLELAKKRVYQSGIKVIVAPRNDWAIKANLSDLSLVLTNLINNSCDEMKNYKEKWVKIDAQIVDLQLWITVTDSGLGVAKEYQEKIFDLQFSTKKKGEGTGIGLGIVREVIKRYDFELFLNTKHENTQFVVCIPIKSIKDLGSLDLKKDLKS